MSTQNWRIENDAEDYFRNRQKKLDLADRRPVIRKPSDLVGLGPGINGFAVRVTNFNDILATYNGYYSALATALNRPSTSSSYVGSVISDAEIGGVQEFIAMTSGAKFRRIFTRNPADASVLIWGSWTAV